MGRGCRRYLLGFATKSCNWILNAESFSGGSRISQRRVRQLQRWGANLLFLPIFPKTAWNWRNLDWEGGGGGMCPWHPTLDPPMETFWWANPGGRGEPRIASSSAIIPCSIWFFEWFLQLSKVLFQPKDSYQISTILKLHRPIQSMV